MRFAVLCSLLVPLILVGCAKTQLIGALPSISDSGQTAQVYVIRTNALSARIRSATVAVNGDEVLTLSSNQHIRFTVPADEFNREVSVGARMPDGVAGWDQITLICQPGETYYLLIDSGQQDDLMTRLSADLGLEWVQKTSYVDLGGLLP